MRHNTTGTFVIQREVNKLPSIVVLAPEYCQFLQPLRPGSDAVLHMNRIEFNELSSCEVRRLNQFETADII